MVTFIAMHLHLADSNSLLQDSEYNNYNSEQNLFKSTAQTEI